MSESHDTHDGMSKNPVDDTISSVSNSRLYKNRHRVLTSKLRKNNK
jgi:hypothetical protein